MHRPRIRGLSASAGVWLWAMKVETENSATPWALRLGKELYFTFYLQLDLEIEHRL